MENSIVELLTRIGETTPIYLFVIIGSVVEELIPLVPSPFVVTTAGALAAAQNYGWTSLFALVLFVSAIKTVASWVWYAVADKTEDVVVGNYGKKFGISHQKLERIGKMLSKGVGDEIAIIILRAIPIIPTSAVSIMAGFIKLDIKPFLWTTFLGMTIRNTIYILVGTGVMELAL